MRMRRHAPLDYADPRTRDGKTKPGIMRHLQRYMAREFFALMKRRDLAAPELT